MYHLANHRVEQAGLSTANFTNNDYELSFLDLKVNVFDVQDVVETARCDWNVVYFVATRHNLLHPLSNSGLSLLLLLLVLLLRLLLQFVLLLLIQQSDAPAEATLDVKHVLGGVFFLRLLLDEAFLNFGRKVETIETNHGFFDPEVLAVQALDLVDATLDSAHHLVSHCHGTEAENVAVVDVETVDEKWHELMHGSLNELVELVPIQGLVLEGQFFLIDGFDFLEEFALPAVQFDALDVVERLVDVSHAFVVFLSLLLVHLALGTAANVAHDELGYREDDNDEAVPANVRERKVAGNNEVEWALYVIRQSPDEGPNSIRLAHDN